MKIIKYTYKFRLKPTKDQEVLLNKHFGFIRWIYNYFLNQRKQEYLNNKKSISYNKQSASLTLLKQQEETEWLKETNSQSLQYSLKCLDQAYQNFFNKKKLSFLNLNQKSPRIHLQFLNMLKMKEI